MSNVSFRTKQGKAEMGKQKVTAASLAAVATMSLFGMCDCMVDSDIGMGDLLLVLGIMHVCGQRHVPPGMDWAAIANY